jgi:hypothetical protein
MLRPKGDFLALESNHCPFHSEAEGMAGQKRARRIGSDVD